MKSRSDKPSRGTPASTTTRTKKADAQSGSSVEHLPREVAVTAPYYGLKMRKLALVSAKRLEPDEHFRRMLDTAEQFVAEPYTGVTIDGNVVRGLYPMDAAGVSTDAIRHAADAFLATLDSDQRSQVSFAVDS